MTIEARERRRQQEVGSGESVGKGLEAGGILGLAGRHSLRAPHLFHHGVQSHCGEVELPQHHAQDLAGPGGKEATVSSSCSGSWDSDPARTHQRHQVR